LPSADEQRRREWDLVPPLARVAAAGKGDVDRLLAGVDLTPAKNPALDLGLLPPALAENRTRYTPLSTVAWSHEVFDGQRSWLLTHDYTWVPKDRVAPYPEVHFQGVELGKGARLPLAFFRGADRPKYRKTENGELIESGEKWPRLSRVELTGNQLEVAREKYLETREQGLWVKERDAVVPKLRATTPWGDAVGAEIAPPAGQRRTWLEASVMKGWLIAYENTRPVYVTMISPGRGGTPIPGKEPLETASTPTGTFNITGKFATATMEAPNDFIHSDVPWTQNFSGPHALHGAYWHDDWGNRKSAGCINVSPIDGRWLFNFTEPALPEGWHGVRWRPEAEPATLFIVHK
jgi:L,D-transpeptidase catalytic domain